METTVTFDWKELEVEADVYLGETEAGGEDPPSLSDVVFYYEGAMLPAWLSDLIETTHYGELLTEAMDNVDVDLG